MGSLRPRDGQADGDYGHHHPALRRRQDSGRLDLGRHVGPDAAAGHDPRTGSTGRKLASEDSVAGVTETPDASFALFTPVRQSTLSAAATLEVISEGCCVPLSRRVL